MKAGIPLGASSPALSSPLESSTSERELSLLIWPGHFVDFFGSSAQLEAEGLIPAGFTWPKGREQTLWQTGRLEFFISRTRPKDLKGPMRRWVEGDYWRLRIRVSDQTFDSVCRFEIQRKTQELAQDLYRLSPAGRAAFAAHWQAYWRAENDPAFQAFKARVPGWLPAPRGRKPQAVTVAPRMVRRA